MHKKFFISYSYQYKKEFELLDKKLRDFLKKEFSIKATSFVYDYHKKATNKQMMSQALKEIKRSDLLIAELSYKSIGIGLEVGYAKALGKNVIYIHKKGTELSTTMDGIADFRIEYKNIEGLLKKLKTVLLEIH